MPTISQLPSDDNPSTSGQIPVTDGGTTKKITIGQIQALIQAAVQVYEDTKLAAETARAQAAEAALATQIAAMGTGETATEVTPSGSLVTSSSITVTGTVTGGNAVWVSFAQNGTEEGSRVQATVSNGAWSAVLTLPATPGSYTVNAYAVQTGGSPLVTSSAFTVSAPAETATINALSGSYTEGDTINPSGTVANGSALYVSLSVGGTEQGSRVAATVTGSNWTASVTAVAGTVTASAYAGATGGSPLATSNSITVAALAETATVATPSGSFTSGSAITVTGTVANGSTVYVALNLGGSQQGSRVAATVTGSNWTASLTPASAGSYTVSAYAASTGGSALATSGTFTVNAPAETATISTPAGGTTGASVTLTGTVQNAGAIWVSFKTGGSEVGSRVQATITGSNWSVTTTYPGSAASYTASPYAAQTGGTALATSSAFTVSAPAETATISNPAGGTVSTSATLTGTVANAGQVWVSFALAGTEQGSRVQATITGSNWSVTTTYPASAGSYTASAYAASSGGSALATSSVFTVAAAPALSLTTPTGVTAGSSFVIGGSYSNYGSTPTLTYSLDSGSFASLPAGSTVSGGAISLHMGAVSSGSHTVQVKDSNGVLSNTVTFSASAAAAPGQVTGLTAGTPTSSTVPYTWSVPSGTIDHYLVSYTVNGGSTLTATTGTNSITLTGIAANAAVGASVQAVNGTGAGTASSNVPATTAAASAADVGPSLTMSSPVYGAGKFGTALTSGSGSAATTLAAGSQTWECWVKASAAPSVDAFPFADSGHQNGISVGVAGGAHPGQALAYMGGYNVASGVNVCDGAWHHVALVTNAAGDKLSTPPGTGIYVDGVLGGFDNYVAITPNPTLVVSAANGISVDEAAVFSGMRYTAGFTPPSAEYTSGTSNILLDWHFDQSVAVASAVATTPTGTLSQGSPIALTGTLSNISGLYASLSTDGAEEGSRVAVTVAGGNLSVSLTPASTGQYVWALYAASTGGAALAVSSAFTVTSLSVPGQVQSLAAGTPTGTTIPISWAAPSSGGAPSGYSVTYTPSGGSATTVATGSTSTSYTLTGLSPITPYSITVAATNGAGTGTASSPVSATTASAASGYATTASITNGAAAAVASPMISTNHQFAKADIPEGAYPAFYDSTGTTKLTNQQVDYTRVWESDGSMRRAVISAVLPDSFDAYGGANQAKSYKVKPVIGTPNSTPKVLLSDIAAQDIKVLFSGFDCGSDTFQARVNDIIAHAAPGVYVNSLATNASASSGATTLSFASLTGNVTVASGNVQPFTVTKGMQVTATNVPTGTYVASVSGSTVTLSAATTGTVASGASIKFDAPVWGYEQTKSGPVCSEWRFWSYLMRTTDGAVHKWVRCDIFLKAWDKAGHWEIRAKVSQPNVYGTHPSGTVGIASPGGTGQNTSPIPRFLSIATLQNGATVLQSWGGANDFRLQTMPASALNGTTNKTTFFATRLSTSYGYTDLKGMPFTIQAASGGTLPSGVVAGQPYWIGSADYGATFFFCTSRAIATQVIPWGNWATNTAFAAKSAVLVNNAIYYTVNGGTSASSGGGPSGSGSAITDGTVTWKCVSLIVGTAGSGNLTLVPVAACYANTAWIGADPLGQPIWWQGSGALAARPNMLFGPQQDYLVQKSKATPPYDLTTTPYKHTSLDYDFERGAGVTWQNTFGVNTPPAWNWGISVYGDNPGDERVGDISNNCAWLLRQPDDPKGALQVRNNALCFADQPIWFINERSGFALIGNMGPGRASGSNYPGLGSTDSTFASITVNDTNYPTSNTTLDGHSGYLNSYGPLSDAQHWPRPWYVPALIEGDPLWTEIGIAGANTVLLSESGGATGGRHFLSSTTSTQYSGFSAGLIDRPRAMAWGTLSQTRVEAHLPDDHPLLPYYRDNVDDIAAAFVDYYITSSGVGYGTTTPSAIIALGIPNSGDYPGGTPPLITQNYMDSFMAGVWAQEAWKEQDNGRRTGWATFLNSYFRKWLIDMWDSDISAVRSEYYLAISNLSGQGYGIAPLVSDSGGNYFASPAALYAGNGWTATYPSGPPSTGIANNDPAFVVAFDGSGNPIQGYEYFMYGAAESPPGNYPFDTNNYYTLGAYHLAWLATAGITGASKILTRTKARIAQQGGITWSLPTGTAHYDNSNAACYFCFNVTPPS